MKSHKKTAVGIALAVVLLIAGGTVGGIAVAKEQAHATAVQTHTDAATAYAQAKQDYSAAIGAAAQARKTAEATVADIDATISAAADFADANATAKLTTAKTALTGALSGDLGKSADVPKTDDGIPTVGDDAENGALDDASAKLRAATSTLATQTQGLTAFTKALGTQDIADAIKAGKVDVANAVVASGQAKLDASGSAGDDTKNSTTAALNALKAQFSSQAVTADAIKAVVDTSNAVKAANDAAVAAAQQAQQDAANANYGGGSDDGYYGGSDDGGSSSGGDSSGGDSYSGGGGSSSGGGDSSPSSLTVTGGASEGKSGQCARVGSASSTGGSIFAPGGVTNYTKSWTGSSWSVTWYVCE
ncbi:hypothetical protein PFZ49_02015 [Microbacterium lacticum]|uniref:hypothetical protein n=1 Tax=Microbacterium lacticum TaxID=33885 RepID=UPI003A8679BF